MDGTVLVADDDRTIRTVLTQAFTRAGCKVHATASLETLMRWLGEGKGDLVISDVMMPDGNGLQALPQISELRPGLPVIVISAQNNILTAIQASEANAFDYLPKPFDLPDLMKRAARALNSANRPSAKDARAPRPVDDLPLIGRTAQMQALYQLVAKVMNTDLTVLITGESGTGKSLIARVIHDFSDRRNLPFVIADAADLGDAARISDTVLRARRGTILFDEIGDLDAAAQLGLVRLLDGLAQDAPRILTTSQQNLAQRITDGSFRQDLFYRLGGVTIAAPALRERTEDILLLAEHFLARAEREGMARRHISKAALPVLRAYAWPGNVRQLENTMKRLALTGSSAEITQSEVEAALGPQPQSGSRVIGTREKLSDAVSEHLRRYFDLHGEMLPPPGVYARILREVEVPLIEIALEATQGNQAKCAELLGINRNTLRKKITEQDIRVTRRRKLM